MWQPNRHYIFLSLHDNNYNDDNNTTKLKPNPIPNPKPNPIPNPKPNPIKNPKFSKKSKFSRKI